MGIEKGIQGHHNSCYLDATLFGIFAFSDAFDDIFLEEPKSMNNKSKKIQNIIKERVVYPLRQ